MPQEINVPDLIGRIESGALQINQDWPMLVIRGDDAMYLAQMIEIFNRVLTEDEKKRVRFPLDYLNGIKSVILEEIIVKSVIPNQDS